MKWPDYLMLIRHDVSEYNALKKAKEDDSLYREFKREYDEDFRSEKSRALAEKVHEKYDLKKGDHDTPLYGGSSLARATGKKFRADNFPIPDIIFVSPYTRTLHTLDQIVSGWPELRNVKVVEDERIREQDHGLATLYYDWRIFHVMYPEQKRFYDLNGSYWYRYPQGENVPDVRERIRSWVTTIVRDFAGKKILVITHHLTILSVRANLERLDAAEFIRLDHEEKPINCGITLYKGNPHQSRGGKLILEIYNKKYY